MAVRRVLRLLVLVCVLAGLWVIGAVVVKKPKPVPAPISTKNPISTKAPNVNSKSDSDSDTVAVKIRKIEPVENKVAVGVFNEDIVGGKTKFEQVLGIKAAVIARYQAWGDKGRFPRVWALEAIKEHRAPFITWEPWKFSKTDFDQPEYRLSIIAAGKYDVYIKQWLSDARDLPGPVFVRFAHEMNGNWYPWGRQVNSPADYVAAWRHIVDIGREAGADNITWVWGPNEIQKGENLDEYYPGNDYVDWIGISGFNWGGLEPWQTWRSFNEIFSPSFAQIKKYNKPIAIAEVGTIENPVAGGQTKAVWVSEMLAQIKNSDPPVSMFIWFNEPYVANGKLYDWRINDSSNTVEAMKSGLADPAFLTKLF